MPNQPADQGFTPEPVPGLSFVDFLWAGFRFPRGTRLLVDTCVLLGYLDTNDPWSPIANWLFSTAIAVLRPPRVFVLGRIQGEFIHAGSRLLAQQHAGKGKRLTDDDKLTGRQGALERLASVMGPYPMIGPFPGSESSLIEWRNLYREFLFGETDALLMATCMVYGLDLLTVDHNLVRLAQKHQAKLTERGYHFTIYYTPQAQSAVPAIEGD